MKIDYPLAKIIEIKKRRVEEAERNVKIKEEILQKEQKILAEKEAERDRVRDHRDKKLKQLRHQMDTGTTTDKIQQAKIYLKICQEKVIVEDKKVTEQEQKVEIAEKNVETAKNELNQKRLEVDKLLTHEKDWRKERQKELEAEEGRQQDEIGSLVHSLRKRRGY